MPEHINLPGTVSETANCNPTLRDKHKKGIFSSLCWTLQQTLGSTSFCQGNSSMPRHIRTQQQTAWVHNPNTPRNRSETQVSKITCETTAAQKLFRTSARSLSVFLLETGEHPESQSRGCIAQPRHPALLRAETQEQKAGAEFRQALGDPAQVWPALQQVTQQPSQDCCKQPAFSPFSLAVSQKVSANSTRESSLKEIIHMHVIYKETFGQKKPDCSFTEE